MALSRLKTWISEILTAADLNAEFDNILNNALTLISPLTGALDADGKEIILDADADTSVTADTDDQIDFKVGGSDLYRMTSTGFSTLSSATITSSGALTVTSGGATVTAGDVNLTAGALNTARATVASAATTADIWAADGNQIDWTGTTTCTGFPAAPQAGASRTLICAAAAPFTAGANMLIDGVTSGNTVTCAANDIVIVRAVTTTQFRLSRVRYDRAGGAMELLQTVTASASATVDLTAFSSDFNSYIIRISGVRPATDGSFLAAQLTTGGVLRTTANYTHFANGNSGSASYVGGSNSNAASIAISGALDSANAASTGDFVVNVENVNQATLLKSISWTGSYIDAAASTLSMAHGAGAHLSDTGVLSAVRFLMSAGNIAAGTFKLYGVR